MWSNTFKAVEAICFNLFILFSYDSLDIHKVVYNKLN